MPKGEDKSSWAYRMVNSPDHMQMITEMSLKQAWEMLDRFQKAFPKVYEYWSRTAMTSHDEMTLLIPTKDVKAVIEELCTGSDRQGAGLQNLQVVGSIPTPCSKTLTIESHSKAGETLCSHLVSPFSCTICYPRKLITHICSLAPAQMQEGDDCLACKQRMEEARIKAIYT